VQNITLFLFECVGYSNKKIHHRGVGDDNFNGD
jgi:hypothetical protein